MFNRHLEVKMAKNDKNVAPKSAISDITFDEKVAHATYLAERVAKKAAWGVAGYVVLDTFRKVLVALAEK